MHEHLCVFHVGITNQPRIPIEIDYANGMYRIQSRNSIHLLAQKYVVECCSISAMSTSRKRKWYMHMHELVVTNVSSAPDLVSVRMKQKKKTEKLTLLTASITHLVSVEGFKLPHIVTKYCTDC